MGTKLQMTSGNHPESNGQAEQMNQVVQHLLRHYIKPSQDDWDEKLPLAASLYNNAVHSTTVFLVWCVFFLADWAFEWDGRIRVRDAAECIVLSRALRTEHVHIDADLDNVLAVQEKLVFQHSILEFAMKVYDYFSTAVNYLILLVPIFAGAFAEATKDDAGKVAQLISNSSFATLQLMYGFSMLIDASKYASDVAGHASRVAELFEALGIIQEGTKNTESVARANLSEAGPAKRLGTGSVIHPRQSRHKKGVEKAAPADHCRLSSEIWTKSNQLADAPGGLTSSPSGGSKLQCTVEGVQRVRADHQKDLSTGTRQTVMEVRGRSIALQEEQTVDWTMVRAPTIFHLCGRDDWLEYSIHRVPRELYALLVAVFPGKWPEDMLVIPTFQCGEVDLCIPPVKRGKGEGAADDTDEVDEGFGKLCMRVGEDMDRMLGVFLRWQSSICGYLQSKGYWADSVDPSSGYALAPRGGWGNTTSSTHQQGHAGSQQDPLVEKRIMEKPPQEHWESKLCYSEVYAARVLLGYEVQQVGACPVVVHPRFGTRAYPASLVTTAPLEPLLEAISAARDGFSGQMEAEPELVSAGDKSSAEGGKGVGQEHKKEDEEEEESGDDKSWVKVAGHSEIMQESWDVNEKQKPCLVIPDNSMQIENPSFAEQRLLDQCPILPPYNLSRGKNTSGLGREQVHDDALDEVEKELLMRASAMTIKQSTTGENGKVEQGSTAALSVTTSHMMRQETAISGDRQTANDQDVLVIKEMTCSIPDSGRVIVKDLTVRLQQGESLLVMGPSGCGKTTIVKAIGGIWPLDADSCKILNSERTMRYHDVTFFIPIGIQGLKISMLKDTSAGHVSRTRQQDTSTGHISRQQCHVCSREYHVSRPPTWSMLTRSQTAIMDQKSGETDEAYQARMLLLITEAKQRSDAKKKAKGAEKAHLLAIEQQRQHDEAAAKAADEERVQRREKIFSGEQALLTMAADWRSEAENDKMEDSENKIALLLSHLTDLLATCITQQEDIHTLDDALTQVHASLQQLEQRPVAAPVVSSSNTSDRLEALEIDVGSLKDGVQLHQTATQQLEQRICTAANHSSSELGETAPKFDGQEIFCDSMKTDPISWFRKFELTLQLHYVKEHKHHGYLYSRLGGACQAWLDNLLSKYGVVAADLHTKINWDDLKAAWHKRFQVESWEIKAMDNLMVFEQGTYAAATEAYFRFCGFGMIYFQVWRLPRWSVSGPEPGRQVIPGLVLSQFADIFESPTGVVLDRPVSHEIILEAGAMPPKGCIYRMSEEELTVLRAELDDLLDKGWIRPSSSPYGAPVLFVRKKNKDLRLCIDYSKLNAQTVKNAGPLPRIDDLLERLGGAKYFSKLNLKLGYHQISIRPNGRYTSAFKTRYGHSEWVVIPFGLTNAPTTFQATMTNEFRAMLDRFVLVYLDDILVYSRSLEDHLEHLRRVLETLRRTKYKANRDKCEFVWQELEYLGHFVTPEGISPLSDKIQAIQEWPEPRNVTDVRSFLGLAGYYQHFIKGHSKIATHLTKLQCEDRPFDFGEEARGSFLALKAALLSAEVLRIFDPLLPARVTTDASGYGIGAVLEQHDGVDWHPVEYFSKKVPVVHSIDDARKKELLAFVHALKRWHHFLLGRSQFRWVTNNNLLVFYKTQDTVNNTIARWMAFIDQFDFFPDHISGKSNRSVKMVEWNERETQAPNVIVLTQTPLMARGGLLAQLIYPLLPVDRGDLAAALSETTDFELRCQGKGASRVAAGQQEDNNRGCDEYQPFLLKEQVIQWNPCYGKEDGGGGGDGGGDTTTQLGGSRRPTFSSSFSGSRCWTREWAHGKWDRRRVPPTFRRGWMAIHKHPEWQAKLRKVLEMVDLSYLLQRVGGDWEAQIDWRNAVSLGEQQRLSIARVFFHMPQLVVLDEATSALGEEMEVRILHRTPLIFLL
ncbi:hypothetical protein CBR_g48559 [Chara braunii]|uniref:Reverse transcriptase domain-containing protein n=1 Tax=Chara braunii TaxID=69332 RepID=A0A388M397_CHABU|nr:hypothetical protein CBR_g48559 [Chara braunii]|eukprot:GBG88949.1 hypothetical protein CBR_g48559 [Chara braunii]